MIINNDYTILYLIASMDSLADRIKELETENEELKKSSGGNKYDYF